MKVARSFLLIWLLAVCIVAGCNRPAPTLLPPAELPGSASGDPFTLTRTSLSAQLVATLTAVVIPVEPSLEPTVPPPAPEPTQMPPAQPSEVAPAPSVETTALPPTEPPQTAEPAEATATTAVELVPSPTATIAQELLLTPAEAVTGQATVTSPPVTPGAVAQGGGLTATPAASLIEPSPSPLAVPITISPAQSPQAAGAPLAIPEVYVLRRGEFPWCLARRFDIDPLQIMWLNGFGPGQVFHAGQPVLLPQNPVPFPGDRALHFRPATYRVLPRDTIYSVACYYGDLDPLELAAANGLTPPYLIDPGQDLIIP